VERREMKVERKYNRTLSKGSRRGTEYSEPQFGSNPNVNIIDSNNTDLRNSIDADKSYIDSQRSESYSFCDTCEWNGYPNQKIVRLFYGYRSEDEDGFIYKFREYDYPLSRHRRKHIHVFNHRHNGSGVINSNNAKAISNKRINNVLKGNHSMDGPIY
jgi:hypothetical protein